MRFIILLLILIPNFIWANTFSDELKNYFSSPLDIPLLLSGNFGEIRNNHFHSGIDFKTQGREGLKVYATANGTVSRIKVSAFGYGLALYIDHPNGYTSVYGHLSKYNSEISDYIKNLQYKQESFEIDHVVHPGTFNIKKGDIIAYSGNSGGSGGPHLHFEIRETKSEMPINPLFFNFKIKDNIAPVIKSLMVYTISNDASVNGINSKKSYNVVGSNGKYYIENNAVINANGLIGLGLRVNDFLDGSNNKCGIYENDLYINNQLIYSFKMDKFSFDNTRYVNSYIDYSYKKNNSITYQKSFIDIGNKLPNFPYSKNNGLFTVNDGNEIIVLYKIRDVHNNESSLSFKIIGNNIRTNTLKVENNIKQDKACSLSEINVVANFDEGTFYNDLYLDFKELNPLSNSFSKLIVLGCETIPIHKAYELRIKSQNLPQYLRNKAFIASVSKDNKSFSYIGGDINGDWIEINSNILGKFTVMVDDVPPSIYALSIDNNTTLNNQKQINFRISDKLSGIKSYRGEIDGKWVLFEYDYKTNILNYTFDFKRFEVNRNHILKLKVTDKVGNIAEYNATFYK